jgi:ferredoxin
MEVIESVSWLGLGFMAILVGSVELLWIRKGRRNVINMRKSTTILRTMRDDASSGNDKSDNRLNNISDFHHDSNGRRDFGYDYTGDGDMRTRTTNTVSKKVMKNPFRIILESSLCIACGSCETLAPNVFVIEKDKMINPKARVRSKTCVASDEILAAAATCPTKAIKIVDRNSGTQICP